MNSNEHCARTSPSTLMSLTGSSVVLGTGGHWEGQRTRTQCLGWSLSAGSSGSATWRKVRFLEQTAEPETPVVRGSRPCVRTITFPSRVTFDLIQGDAAAREVAVAGARMSGWSLGGAHAEQDWPTFPVASQLVSKAVPPEQALIQNRQLCSNEMLVTKAGASQASARTCTPCYRGCPPTSLVLGLSVSRINQQQNTTQRL